MVDRPKPNYVPKPDDIDLSGVYRVVFEGKGTRWIYIKIDPQMSPLAMVQMDDGIEETYMTEKDWEDVRKAMVIDKFQGEE
jgi:hypothetical protein